MPSERKRNECGESIPEGAEYCPRCLFRLGLEAGEPEEGREAGERGQGTGDREQVAGDRTGNAAGREGQPANDEPRTTNDEPRTSSQPPPVGTVIRYFGDYELLEEVARGAMGVVYKARQVSLDRVVAVKLLLAGSHATEAFIKRFETEAKAAANLKHPNIVAVHEVGAYQGQHYFSMDFIEGPSLAKVVHEKPLPAKEAAGYVRIIADAVHFAHQHHILHRDLKPSNVLIDSDDQPRITDFGLAKRMDIESTLSSTGQLLGTPGYMPPEQVESRHGEVGPHSDIYSIGATLYHLLTGRPPFQGENLADVLEQVRHADPVPPRRLNPSVPRDLETVCLKCLEKRSKARYSSARELADDLGRFLNHEPIRARPVSRPEKAWRWCQRNPALAGLSAALLAALGGGVRP